MEQWEIKILNLSLIVSYNDATLKRLQMDLIRIFFFILGIAAKSLIRLGNTVKKPGKMRS